ncbi:glycosyl hydrolase [Halobacteriales archaeon QS_3_64_16]|nr:MAG: glycosyl hydrolase [Halobacteriales archaeon QS_3_64_16]
MALVIGTREGVFRSSNNGLEDTERVLDAGDTPRVRAFSDHGVFAATRAGLYRSADEGSTWENLGVPHEEVFSVVASPDGESLFAGTHPAHLYKSSDRGESWEELEGFQDLHSREEWYTPRHRNEAHIRSLGIHPDTPDRIVAGVEVGGVHLSEDGGETWSERRDGLHGDVHHVLVCSPEQYVASCGGGLYATTDAGRSWRCLDSDLDHRYFRETFAQDGRLYAAAARGPPGSWSGESGADAALFESTDGGDTFEATDYPGGPEEFVLAWSAFDGRVLAGTNDGRVLVREDGVWETLGELPATVRSLTVAPSS